MLLLVACLIDRIFTSSVDIHIASHSWSRTATAHHARQTPFPLASQSCKAQRLCTPPLFLKAKEHPSFRLRFPLSQFWFSTAWICASIQFYSFSRASNSRWYSVWFLCILAFSSTNFCKRSAMLDDDYLFPSRNSAPDGKVGYKPTNPENLLFSLAGAIAFLNSVLVKGRLSSKCNTKEHLKRRAPS